jgi:hypothetical protein
MFDAEIMPLWASWTGFGVTVVDTLAVHPRAAAMPLWASWTAFAVGAVGTLLTAVAFFFTFREARAAKKAAHAATEAANQAKEAISDRVTIADLTAIRSSFIAIVMLLDAQKPEMAAHEVRQARQRVNELRERPGFEGNREHVGTLVADLAELQATIERKLWSEPTMTLPLPEISKMLAGHSDQLAAWGEQLRYD